ncbi:MAG: HlyD family secretion protein, partial [Flavobacterium sp.]
GSRFSLLPPDNATGNFVKTIQRLPVKISLTPANDKEKVKLLRPGMNVEVDVHVK